MAKSLVFVLITCLFVSPTFAESVDTAWVRSWPGISGTYGRDVAVDHAGNVVVTGSKTIKYAPDGTLLWSADYYGLFVGVDAQNDIYVGNYIGYPSSDIQIRKFFANGDTAWTRIYDGPSHGMDFSTDMVVDDDGHCYITGQSADLAGDDVYATIKYEPNGDTAWVRTYNGAPTDWDRAYAITIDKSGNVYVTGYSRLGTFGAATVKYYPNGDTAWVRRFADHGWAEGHDIAVNDSGDVFVSLSNYTYGAIKYDKEGRLLWQSSLGHGCVGVDTVGNSYFTYGSFGSEFNLVKYQPDGDTAWTRKYHAPVDPSVKATDLVVDPAGNSFVTGYGYLQLAEDDTATDYITIEYDTDGNAAWIQRYDGVAHSQDRAMAIAIDQSGNTYVTGHSRAAGGVDDMLTIKYSPVEYICGDVDHNSFVNVSDAVYLVTYIFAGGPPPQPLASGDIDCNGMENISDAVYLINYIFGGGPDPCAGC